MSPIEIVRAKEEEIRGNRFESAFAVDEEGQVILDRIGEAFRVDFSPEEVNRFSAGQGVIFTHNHPRGWGYPAESPLRSGSSFTDADVRLACQARLAEMRAVTPTRRFLLRPAPGGWSLDYWEAVLKPIYGRHEQEVRRQFRLFVRHGRMGWEVAGQREAHEIWTRVATEAGLTYGEEQE